jgi:hypothetical protein
MTVLTISKYVLTKTVWGFCKGTAGQLIYQEVSCAPYYINRPGPLTLLRESLYTGLLRHLLV